jgi:GTPase SAR1 family protein
MAVNFEQGRKNLLNIIEIYNKSEGDKNEATTRVQLIDRIFFDCFGWEREDLTAEERLEGKYIDYAFYSPECLLLVEAKKTGIYFELPIGENQTIYKITYFSETKENIKVHRAIKQLIEYCQLKGTPFGVVSNGHQLIAFLGSRSDGHPPLEGTALVFDSLEKILDNYLLAWQCLSKAGIANRRLSRELSESTIEPLPNKLAQTISNYPGVKKRNIIQADLQILSDLLIEDIENEFGLNDSSKKEYEFLKECYCETGALSQYAELSKEFLKTRYSALQDAEGSPFLQPIQTKEGISSEFLNKAITRRPILLLGDKGVGKSMFIKHFCYVSAEELLKDAFVIYIDFGAKPTLEKHIPSLVAEEIKTQLFEKYSIDLYEAKFVKTVLHREISQFEQGIYGEVKKTDPTLFELKKIELIESKVKDADLYLKLAMDHLVYNRHRQIVIFLDNSDQRSYEFQDHVFLLGQTMSATWPVTVYVSIRPETFYRSRLKGTIGAYHPKAFTIAPPRVDEVIKKRLNYGISLLEKGAHLGLESTSLRSDNLRDYLKILVISFEYNKNLIKFLDNMSNGNIRLALDYVKAFLGSGHVNTGEAIDKFRSSGRYYIPLHAFVRAVLFGDQVHYHPDSSMILNLFDILLPDGKEHFLSPILLAHLIRLSQQSNSSGYVQVNEIFKYLQVLGYQPNQISWALDRLRVKNLIESPPKRSDDDSRPAEEVLRATTIGAYSVLKLVSQFTYIDAMIVDTPILDTEYRARIGDVEPINDRLSRASIFCEYLNANGIL